jgi:hypothetical protein
MRTRRGWVNRYCELIIMWWNVPMTLGQEVANTVPLRKPLMQNSRTELTLAETHSQSDSHILFPSGWRSTSQIQVWANTGSYIRVANRLLPQANALVAEGLIGKLQRYENSKRPVAFGYAQRRSHQACWRWCESKTHVISCRLRVSRAC